MSLVFYKNGDDIVVGKKLDGVYYWSGKKDSDYAIWKDEGEMLKVGKGIKVHKKFVDMNKLCKVENVGRCLPFLGWECTYNLIKINGKYCLMYESDLSISNQFVMQSYDDGGILWRYTRNKYGLLGYGCVICVYKDECIIWDRENMVGFGQSKDWILSVDDVSFDNEIVVGILDKNTRRLYRFTRRYWFERKKRIAVLKKFKKSKPEIIDGVVKELLKCRDIEMSDFFKG